MGRGDYILGKMQFIFWIPINLPKFLEMPPWWACLVYMFGFILLSSLQYFITLVRLVTWSQAFCSI